MPSIPHDKIMRLVGGWESANNTGYREMVKVVEEWIESYPRKNELQKGPKELRNDGNFSTWPIIIEDFLQQFGTAGNYFDLAKFSADNLKNAGVRRQSPSLARAAAVECLLILRAKHCRVAERKPKTTAPAKKRGRPRKTALQDESVRGKRTKHDMDSASRATFIQMGSLVVDEHPAALDQNWVIVILATEKGKSAAFNNNIFPGHLYVDYFKLLTHCRSVSGLTNQFLVIKAQREATSHALDASATNQVVEMYINTPTSWEIWFTVSRITNNGAMGSVITLVVREAGSDDPPNIIAVNLVGQPDGSGVSSSVSSKTGTDFLQFLPGHDAPIPEVDDYDAILDRDMEISQRPTMEEVDDNGIPVSVLNNIIDFVDDELRYGREVLENENGDPFGIDVENPPEEVDPDSEVGVEAAMAERLA